MKYIDAEKMKELIDELKALVTWSKSYSASGITGEDAETMLNWLEKQGKEPNYNPYKTTVESIIAMVEKYSNNGDLRDFYDNVKVKCKDAVEYDNTWIEKQGHTDSIIEKAKTEKQRVIITETDGNANIDWDTRSVEDVRKLLECGLQYINTKIKKQGEQKSLECGKDDEIMKTHTIQIIKKYWNSLPDIDYDENEISESCYNWLKSLRPQHHWKPSEEQMDYLKKVYESYDFCDGERSALESLYDDLKKL